MRFLRGMVYSEASLSQEDVGAVFDAGSSQVGNASAFLSALQTEAQSQGASSTNWALGSQAHGLTD